MKKSKPEKEPRLRRYAPHTKSGRLQTRQRNKETITETIEVMMNIYSEALVAYQDDPRLSIREARVNAGRVWRAELPELTDLSSVLTYIALIAWGQRLRILDVSEAKTMMFMAQTQLTALSKV